MIALACDYRVMTDGAKRNAWMCMNEVDFGASWPVSFAALVRAKLSAIQRFTIEGHRFTPTEARDAGLVDEIVSGGTRGVLRRALEIAEEKAPKAREGVWGVIKVRSSLFYLLQSDVRMRIPTRSLTWCAGRIVSPSN
jgi:enoyl-CoA hydratase/carnithine racemase